MLKFKNIIRQNKTFDHSKVTFYLNKCASKLKNTQIQHKNVRVLSLNLTHQSTLPYIFAQFKMTRLGTKGAADF